MATSRDEVECWLTDMDGVLVHENHPLPGAPELIRQWTDSGTEFLVLTNNSIFTPRDLAARLRASGIQVPEERPGRVRSPPPTSARPRSRAEALS